MTKPRAESHTVNLMCMWNGYLDASLSTIVAGKAIYISWLSTVYHPAITVARWGHPLQFLYSCYV